MLGVAAYQASILSSEAVGYEYFCSRLDERPDGGCKPGEYSNDPEGGDLSTAEMSYPSHVREGVGHLHKRSADDGEC